MAHRKRNHYIPRFLLNRFAARRDGKKSFIWQLSRDRVPKRPISTRDAAVSGHFYGGPSTGVEDAFGSYETGFSSTLDAIERGEDPKRHAESLRQLVWTLAVRTRALRVQFSQLVESFVTRFAEDLASERGRRAAQRHVIDNLDQMLEDKLAELPEQTRARARAFLATPAGRATVNELIRGIDLRPFAHLLSRYAGEGALERPARDGQIKALSALLGGDAAPDSFRPDRWEVRRELRPCLVLGDAVVVGTDGDGRYGALMGIHKEWEALYLPLSPSHLLIASRGGFDQPPTPERINCASAENSMSHIFSHECNPAVIALARLISSGEPILQGREIDHILADVWDHNRGA